MITQNQNNEFFVGKTKVGGSAPCFIVAEIGINFNGKYENAINLIDVAAKAGCNAVKFQLFRAEKMYPGTAGKYKLATGKKEEIVGIVKKGELPYFWVPKLRNYAKKLGLEFFSSVCDEKSADTLEKYKGDAFKIASYEITHLPLIEHIAKKNKPIIFSCGGASLSEISEAIEAIKKQGNKKIALLHCIGQYPAPLNSLNLKVIQTLKTIFPEVIIGYSDHSSDPVVAPRVAVLFGAKIIEKHITLGKNLLGPDHSFALNPNELSLMVETIRQAEEELKQGKKVKISPLLLGTSKRETYEGEKWIREFTYRCIFATEIIKKGEIFSKKNTSILRPGNLKRGLEPKYYKNIIGYKAIKNINKYQSINWQDFEKDIKNPQITIIIRAYNSEKFISVAIESVLNQTINSKFYEVVVIDDGSTDKTNKVLNKYKGILKIIKQKHRGAIVALSRGLKETNGGYIIILDSDDVFKNDILEKLYLGFKKEKDAKFSYCDYEEVSLNKKNKIVSLKGNIFNSVAGGIMYKKEVLKEFNGYDEDLIFPEYDLLIKVSQKYKGVYVQEPLYIYKRRKNSITGDKNVVEQGIKQLFSKYGAIKELKSIKKYG